MPPSVTFYFDAQCHYCGWHVGIQVTGVDVRDKIGMICRWCRTYIPVSFVQTIAIEVGGANKPGGIGITGFEVFNGPYAPSPPLSGHLKLVEEDAEEYRKRREEEEADILAEIKKRPPGWARGSRGIAKKPEEPEG